MENKCSCNYFIEEESNPDKVMKNFNVLALSESDNHSNPKEGEFTSLLKCPKCDSYYLMNVHNSIYPNQDAVSIIKYNPKAEEKGLIKIIKSFEGIITNIELDDYSELYNITLRAIKSMRKGRGKYKDSLKNENKN